jgi:hypothetical protein
MREKDSEYHHGIDEESGDHKATKTSDQAFIFVHSRDSGRVVH